MFAPTPIRRLLMVARGQRRQAWSRALATVSWSRVESPTTSPVASTARSRSAGRVSSSSNGPLTINNYHGVDHGYPRSYGARSPIHFLQRHLRFLFPRARIQRAGRCGSLVSGCPYTRHRPLLHFAYPADRPDSRPQVSVLRSSDRFRRAALLPRAALQQSDHSHRLPACADTEACRASTVVGPCLTGKEAPCTS